MSDRFGYSDAESIQLAADMVERKRHLADPTLTRAYHAKSTSSATAETSERVPIASDSMRRKYSKNEKRRVTDILLGKAETEWSALVKQIQINKSVYGCLSYGQAKKWAIKKRDNIVDKRPGPKVVTAYEKDVWAEMLLYTIEKMMNANNQEEIIYKVTHNVCYNGDIIRDAAKRVRDKPEWNIRGEDGELIPDHRKIHKLEFSDRWVQGFLDRAKFRRRRISRDLKPRASDDEINAHMHTYQQRIIQEEYTSDQV